MKYANAIRMLTLGSAILLLSMVPVQSIAGDYQSLKGVESVKAVFDFRIGAPADWALLHLQVIDLFRTDKGITGITDKPQMVVVFMDKSVKLMSTNTKGLSAKDKKIAGEIAKLISTMSKNGVRFEICMLAVNYFKVDPKTLLPELHQVPHGWVASFGYQAQGYALVPVF